MKKILIALMLVIPLFANSQEESNLVSKDSLNKDSLPALDLVGSIETNLKKEQIKSIGGIAFGISQEKALPILRNKYGREEYFSDNKDIVFKNIKYAGIDFNSVHFLFQSDGINSYFNTCIFILDAKTRKEAIAKQKEMKDILSQKYDFSSFEDDNGFDLYAGGVSPLWDGHWKSFVNGNYSAAIRIGILNYDEELSRSIGIKYAVRIMYGPFNYVKEEF